MYGEDYLDNLFSAVYYEPTGQNALFQSHDGRGSAHHQIRKPSKKPSGGGKKTARGLDASANGFGRPSTGSKFVNNIRQHSSTSKSPAIADHKQKRPVSAPAKKRNGKLYKPASVPEITSYDSYVKRRQMDLARTEPTKKMDSAEYPFFPVLANVQPINESPSRVTYSEPEASVVANDSYFTNSAAYESVMTVEKPSAVNGVKKNSTRPYDLDKQYIDMNEWIGLRQNYIHQVESLEKYERMCGAAQVLSEISMPNFYSLLIAIRKITVRIADHYRMIVLQKETPINLLEIHGYVITMATDLDCLDRQPFVDWTGLHLSYNPFICGYRLDGKISTAMADLNAASKRMAESNPAMIPTELVMDQYETSECRDLSAVVWGAYQEDQRKRRTKAEEDEAIREQMIQASVRKAELAMKREAFEFSGPEAMQARCWKRAWVAWKKAYHLEISIKNMASVRKHMIKRNVFAYLVRYCWIAQNFRRMLQQRAKNLIEMTFQGWFEYLMWCREFNRVRYGFCLHHKQHCFNRLKLLMYYDNTVRSFKKKRRQKPLFLTFRALKRHSVVERFLRKTRLKNGTTISFADMNLRYFIFSRWARFADLSISIDRLDIVCQRMLKRNFFKTWKTEVYGKGFTEQIKDIVASTSTKLHHAFTPIEEDGIPAVEGADDHSVYSKVSRISGSIMSGFFAKKGGR